MSKEVFKLRLRIIRAKLQGLPKILIQKLQQELDKLTNEGSTTRGSGR
tara:strand:+ start:591 stop:734 length:144 start_codon:yes stop_codon:yes gene_type:complete